MQLPNSEGFPHLKPAFENSNVAVAFATDARYAPYLYTAIDSMISHLSPRCGADIIVIVENALDSTTYDKFSQLTLKRPLTSIRFLEVPEKINETISRLCTISRLGPTTYYRLFLAKLLPHYSRIIYCDVDIVVSGDLADLFDADISGAPLGACPDLIFEAERESSDFSSYISTVLGLHNDRKYFNAGVLLIDLDQWRHAGWQERILDQLTSVHLYRYHDQDLLNVVFAGSWYPLDFRWNFYYALLGNNESYLLYDKINRLGIQKSIQDKNWKIIHFTGINPWSTDPILERNVGYYEWEKYAFRNPLIDWTAQQIALTRTLRQTRLNLFCRRLRLILYPSKARKERYRRKLELYKEWKHDFQILHEHLTSKGTIQQTFATQTTLAIIEHLELRNCIRHPLRYLPRLPLFTGRLLSRWIAWKRTPAHYSRFLCIAACVKNEATYLEEWLEYHLMMGVQHFYIYDNDSSDNVNHVLKPYIRDGLVTYISWPGKNQQHAIYRHALRTCSKKTRWLSFIDVDEFIQPLKANDLISFLREHEDVNQLVIQWVYFGSSWHKKRTPGLVIERFVRREYGSRHVGKSIFRPSAAIDSLVHFCHVFGPSVDEDGKPLESFSPTKENCDYIRVNHYATKSKQEYLEKAQKGTSVGGTIAADYFNRLDCNDVEDLSMLAYVSEIRNRIHVRQTRQQ